MKRILILLIIGATMICGCSTVSTVAQNVNPDGSNRTVSQKWTTPPFGTMGAGAGTISAKQGADGSYLVNTGQNVTAVDNTAQTQVANIIATMITSGLGSYLGSSLAQPQSNGQPNILVQLLQAWLAAQTGVAAPASKLTLERPRVDPVAPVTPARPVTVPLPKAAKP